MSFHRTLGLLAIPVLVLSSAAVGQSKVNRPGTLPPQPTQPSTLNRVIMLSGNVIVVDGATLPEPASIEWVCNGRVSREGRTDFKGYFSISIGRVGASEPDGSAEASGGPGLGMAAPYVGMPQNASIQQKLLGCELRASLPGFHSSSVPIPTQNLGSETGVVQVGTIVLQRTGEAPGTTVSATSLNAPKDARKAYDNGHQAIEKSNLPEAQQDLEKAVQLYPQYAAAWLDLGWLYIRKNQLDKARDAFTHARTADGMFVPAYVGLASLAVRESKWQEAAELSAHAAQLDGVRFPAAFYYNSLANYRLGNMELAEKSARKAETLGAERSFPQVSLLLGLMLANRQHYADAAGCFRSYLKMAPTAPNAEKVRQQLMEMEKLSVAESQAVAAPPAK